LTTIISEYIVRYKDLFSEEFIKLESLNKEIEIRKVNVERDIEYFVRQENLWWDYVSESYKEILFRHPTTRKENNTLFHGYMIDKSQLDEVSEMIGEVDDNDFLEVKRLSEINEELKRLKFSTTTNEELKKEEEKTRLRYGRFVKKYFLKLLTQEYDKENLRRKKLRNENYDSVQLSKHLLINEMIMKLSNHSKYKEDFVFELLNNKDFVEIEKSHFSKMDREQYKKFQSVRTYYNGLLKIVGDQCGLGDKLTSHVSRHSFTSITMELIENVSPFDLMNSLGHKNVSTTQTYMKSFGDKSVENINKRVQRSIGLKR
jgi:hypothetical protein